MAKDPILDRTILQLTPTDTLSFRQLSEGGCLTLGGLGAGKTSTVGQMAARSFLSGPYGGLILTVKSDEAKTWIRYIKDAGREKDLIVFGPESPFSFDPLAYISATGKAVGLTESIAEFLNYLLAVGRVYQPSSGERYFEDAVSELVRAAVVLLTNAQEPISISSIFSLVSSIPREPDQIDSPDWQNRSECARIIAKLRQRKEHFSPSQWADLDVGTTPTTTSTKYNAPVSVSSTETLKAITAESGYTNSAVATAAYTINIAPPPVTATPTFSPAPGAYTSTQSITIADSTAGAVIYFTTDGATPTVNSPQYTEPITVSSTETIEAIAVAGGYSASAVATATYTINLPRAATPTFAPPAGAYSSAQSVAISDSTSGAAIYYTTDGTTPSVNSTKYTAPITISSTETIRAIAAASGYTTSAVATGAYTISISSGTISVITNANGNITSIPPDNGTANATFTYNAANRLSSVTGTPTLAASYVYDYAGKRFSKTNPSSTPILYSYAQDCSLIAENNSGMQTDYIYVDGMPIAVLQPGASPVANQVNYIVSDHLGTPQTLVNNDGTPVWSTTDTPFGDGGAPGSSIVQDLRLPGQNYDSETGFHYNFYRDYMAHFGRYLEVDPIGLGGGLNTYAYARGNPVKFTDRWGLDETFNQGEQAVEDAFDSQIIFPVPDTLNFPSPHPDPNPFYLLQDSTAALSVSGDFLDMLAAMNALTGDEPLALALHRAAYSCKTAATLEERNPAAAGTDLAQDLIYQKLHLEEIQNLITLPTKLFWNVVSPPSKE